MITPGTIATILALASAAAAATAPGPITSGTTGWCGMTAYRDPTFFNVDDGREVISSTTPTATGVRYEGSCGVFDVFNFGPGFSQYFSGRSVAFGMGSAEPGLLRLYGVATASIDPAEYDIGVLGTNPYRARAAVTSSTGYADIIVPPPTSGAPNAGDPTTIKAIPRLDCIESVEGPGGVNSAISVSVYTPEAYAADGASYDSVFVATDVHSFRIPCPIFFDAKIFNVTVGTPVVVVLGAGITIDTQNVTLQFPEISYFSNALNTGTLVLKDADDVPLTGQSGKVYSDPGPHPTITTTSTVTTSSTIPPTTTTLPGCAGTCGDGTVETACNEVCDCPATADPIAAAYGCDGAAIVPPQEGCVTCRGCQLVSVRCALAVTTTTIPGGTTTTTLPGQCAGLVGAAAGACAIDAFLAGPLCLDTPAPAKVEKTFRKKLGAVRNALERSLTAKPKKQARLLRGASRKLGKVDQRAAKLDGTKLSPPCATRIGGLAQGVALLIDDD